MCTVLAEKNLLTLLHTPSECPICTACRLPAPPTPVKCREMVLLSMVYSVTITWILPGFTHSTCSQLCSNAASGDYSMLCCYYWLRLIRCWHERCQGGDTYHAAQELELWWKNQTRKKLLLCAHARKHMSVQHSGRAGWNIQSKVYLPASL